MTWMHVIALAFVSFVQLFAAGDIIRRVPKSLDGLTSAERRQAWWSTALAALLVISAGVTWKMQ